MDNEEIDFIARRYRKGRFSPDTGWRRLGISRSKEWRKYRIAAAVSATILLSATAAILYNDHHTADEPLQSMPIETVSPMEASRIIDFENAPLPEVVMEIESVYGVKVEGIPEYPEEYVLSLHYEGTPADLISVINDILGTQMTVTEK